MHTGPKWIERARVMAAGIRHGRALPCLASILLAAIALPAPTLAQDLRIALSSLPSTADPHVSASRIAFMLTDQVYEALAGTDADMQPYPLLAERWERTAEGDWLFHLRNGVAFHDGRPFTSRDIVYSFCRALRITEGNRPFAARLADVRAVEMRAPMQILIRMVQPRAVFPIDVATIPIVAAPAAADPVYTPGGCPDDVRLDSNRSDNLSPAVGTGPYRKTAFGPQSVDMVRHDGYWGNRSPWARVRFQPMAGTSGIKALLEGQVDIVDTPPVETLSFLEARSDVVVVKGPTTMVHYLQVNQNPDAVPTTGPPGAIPNPFTDHRVRRAVSLALPRDLIIRRVAQGLGAPTAQLPGPGMEGHAPDIPDDPYVPEEARRLMAEAGYADGLTTTLLTLPSQSRMAETIAHFLTMVGIRVTVEVEEGEAFWRRLREGDFGMFYAGWVFMPTDPADSMLALLGPAESTTIPGVVGRGAHNYGRYDNPALNDLLSSALVTDDTAERNAILREAQRLATDDAAWIPIMAMQGRWAVRAGIDLQPRRDRLLLAARIGTTSPTR